MNKRDERKARLERHYKTLEMLADKCGVNAEGKKLSLKLWKLELEATKITTAYCNGEIDGGEDGEKIDSMLQSIENQVTALFNNRLSGFHLNRDPRGHALKIEDEIVRTVYADIPLERDWGGYGLLSPEIK